ncbi:MAG: type II toxin-antitoxin system HicB family antitoxin [Rhizobacter sp.]|nr:type II toxin-antitoxin system HicB family antitoxin [Rhizobacter sp.]
MLSRYLQAALHRARYEILPDEGCYFGEVPGLDGVWAKGPTLESCREDLAEVIEEWVLLSVSRRLPVPELDGVRLRIPEPV